jgi:hypothetical protein
MAAEVAPMDVAQIPAILPPAITVSREITELCLAETWLSTAPEDRPPLPGNGR